MNEFPLPHILNFLQKVVPFNTLNRAVMEQIVADTQIAFYPRDEIIIRLGEESGGFLYVVQTGCARITIGDALTCAMIFQRSLSRMENTDSGRLRHMIRAGAL